MPASSARRRSHYKGAGGGGGGEDPDITDLGTDLREYFKLPAGTYHIPVVELNDDPRVYTGGLIDVLDDPSYLHNYDPELPNNGWVIILPAVAPTIAANGNITTQFNYDASLTAGGASITDQVNGGALHFGTFSTLKGVGDIRVMIFGLNVDNGPLFNTAGTRRLKAAYCKSTYPVEQFAQDYDDVATANALTPGGTRMDSTVRALMKGNGNTNGFNLRSNVTPWRTEYITILGCDVTEIGDDAINQASARYIRGHGVRTWYSDNKSLTDDHSDMLQLVGAEIDCYYDYCFFGGHVELVAEMVNGGNITDFEAHHIWQCDSYTTGMSIGTEGTRDFIGGEIAKGNGYLPDWDTPAGLPDDYWLWFGNGRNDGGDVGYYDDISSPPYSFTLSGYNEITHGWPVGITPTPGTPPSGGEVPDRPEFPAVVEHDDNPGVIWRRHVPYDQVINYINTYAVVDPVLGFN